MIQTTEDYAYAVGDEVVVQLAGLTPYDPHVGPRIGCDCMPDWSVGIVLGRRMRAAEGAEAVYLLRLRLRGSMHLLVAPESAIEGIA